MAAAGACGGRLNSSVPRSTKTTGNRSHRGDFTSTEHLIPRTHDNQRFAKVVLCASKTKPMAYLLIAQSYCTQPQRLRFGYTKVAKGLAAGRCLFRCISTWQSQTLRQIETLALIGHAVPRDNCCSTQICCQYLDLGYGSDEGRRLRFVRRRYREIWEGIVIE